MISNNIYEEFDEERDGDTHWATVQYIDSYSVRFAEALSLYIGPSSNEN